MHWLATIFGKRALYCKHLLLMLKVQSILNQRLIFIYYL
jgi:hypothetical protein